MIKVINITYIVNISFETKKVLNKSRKEKLKNLFHKYKFENSNTAIIISNNENKIFLDGKNIVIRGNGTDHKLMLEYIPNLFCIFDVDSKSKQYSIELSIRALCNNEFKNLTLLQEAKIIEEFFNMKSIENKIISNVEYITFMESPKEELVTMSLKMYNEGLIAKAVIIIEDINGIKDYFDDLLLQLNKLTINQLIEKIGD
ncbi:UNVERIFIED_ORG: hypothetical protein B2H93_16030 [Clostridium botulinum]